MARESNWTFGIIDDNQNLIVIDRNDFCLEPVSCTSDVFVQFIKAGYNVTDNMILHFRWLGIDWDYVQLITEEEDNDYCSRVEGLRLFKRSPYLNAYHIASNCVKNDFSLENHFHVEETHSDNLIKNYYKFDVHYNYEGGQYNIVVDIIKFYESLYSNYTLHTNNGKVYVKFQWKKYD